jgi:CRP-like cAMP-binding protein
LAAGQPLEVIYRAERLLEINPEDASAKDALHLLAISRVRPQNAQSFIYDLLLDEQFSLEIVAASGLVERRRGETICEHNDRGTTMFVILKGQVGVFFPKSPQSTNLRAPPPDLIMSQGELAGELAFALRRTRTASLRCLDDSALLVIGSPELFFRIRRAKIGPQLEETLNRKLLQRIIENMWNTATCFRGGAAPSPLAELSTP